MLHTFVANDEKEAYKRGLEETKKITVLKDTIISLLDNMPGMAFTKHAKTGVYLACNQAFVAPLILLGYRKFDAISSQIRDNLSDYSATKTEISFINWS